MRVAQIQKPSHRPLRDVAKHLIVPDGTTGTLWTQTSKTVNKKLGVRFDRWQHGSAALALSTRADGRLACEVDGTGWSAPRQVGKTFTWLSTLFGLGVDRPGSLFLWTAQHSRTHEETFEYMQGYCRRPQVGPFVKRVLTGSGDEAVEFINGSRILFGARERGFGRGIPNVDGEVFDEAQILSHKALEDMLAAMNRSPLGLHIYLGTPPKPGDRCDDFAEMRDEALAYERGQAPEGYVSNMTWIEFGADEGAPTAPEDPEFWPQIAKANPSYPEHTSQGAILRLRKKLGPEGFSREGQGIWGKDAKTRFDLVGWVSLEDAKLAPPKRVALVVAVAEHARSAAIGVAGEGERGQVVVLVHCQEGVNWVPDKLAQLTAERHIVEVTLAPGEARGLEGELTRRHIDVDKKLASNDVAASCTAFLSGVDKAAAEAAAAERPSLAHNGQTELDGAVARAKTRRVGAAETWEDGTAPALVAAAAAFHRWKLQDAPMPAVY